MPHMKRHRNNSAGLRVELFRTQTAAPFDEVFLGHLQRMQKRAMQRRNFRQRSAEPRFGSCISFHPRLPLRRIPHPPRMLTCCDETREIESAGTRGKMPKRKKSLNQRVRPTAIGTERVKTLVSGASIQKRIRQMARRIRQDFPNETLLLVGEILANPSSHLANSFLDAG